MSASTDEMRRSWLVQRLTPKHGGRHGDLIAAFSFGGGLINGGLSDEARRSLPFDFDYMGAAEFEWGAVPKALDRIVKARKKMVVRPACDGRVVVLAHQDHIDEAVRRVEGWAEAPYGGDTKEMVRLHQALNPEHDWDTRTIGGLELDNGFLFLLDDELMSATCSLLGVKR